MHRKLLAVPVLMLGLVLAGEASAGDSHHGRVVGASAFVGLWEGIDIVDGSTQLVSITCSGRKTCDVRLNDTFFTDCGGGAGYAKGEGSIGQGVLTVEDFSLFCRGATGDPPTETQTFAPDFKNGTLIADDGEHPPILFHKISR